VTARTALQRLERILVLVPWLLERGGATVDEVTEHFAITRAELADDLDVLGYCGLPGYGGGDLIEASLVGDRVGVRMADFFRRPLRLSVREAVTLLLAARGLAGVDGLPESAGLRRAVAKLEAALGVDAAGLAIDLRAPGDELVPRLRAAIADREVVSLVYRSASAETTERDVEPWAVVGAQGAWYLQAWCRSARGARDFRLDRIAALRVTGERLRADSPPAAPSAPAYAPQPGDVEVVVDLRRPAWWIADEVVADTVAERRGGVRRVTLRTAAPERIARLLLRAAPDTRVVAPAALRERVRALAADTLARYGATAEQD
jgi:predicted DNA-binding transcriptional regulator YafY